MEDGESWGSEKKCSRAHWDLWIYGFMDSVLMSLISLIILSLTILDLLDLLCRPSWNTNYLVVARVNEYCIVVVSSPSPA